MKTPERRQMLAYSLSKLALIKIYLWKVWNAEKETFQKP